MFPKPGDNKNLLQIENVADAQRNIKRFFLVFLISASQCWNIFFQWSFDLGKILDKNQNDWTSNDSSGLILYFPIVKLLGSKYRNASCPVFPGMGLAPVLVSYLVFRLNYKGKKTAFIHSDWVQTSPRQKLLFSCSSRIGRSTIEKYFYKSQKYLVLSHIDNRSIWPFCYFLFLFFFSFF